MKTICWVIFASLSFLASTTTFAGDPTPANRFGLGLAAYNTAPEYADTSQSTASLYVVYRGERINVDHNELSFNFLPEGNLDLEILLERQHLGYDADASEIFKGMEDRHEIWGLGGKTRYTSRYGAVSLGLFHNPIDDEDVKGAESGSSVNLNFGYPIKLRNFVVTPHIGQQWYSEEVVDFLYGISVAESTATRAAYKGEDAGIPYVGVNIEGMLTENLRLVGGLRFESLPDEISKSPLVDDDNTVRAHVGLAWMF